MQPFSAQVHNHGNVEASGNATLIQNAIFPPGEPIDPIDKVLHELLNAGRSAEYHKEDLQQTKGEPSKGTCKWIKDDPRYQSWRDGQFHQLLRISGGPGRGKTMLSLFLVQELDRDLASDPTNSTHTLVYFFCSFSDYRLNTACAILSSLIHQLVLKKRTLGRHAASNFSSHSKANETLRSATALWKILNKILNDPDIGKILCILDGLDECDQASQDYLASCFAELVTATPGTRAYGMNIMLLSRGLRHPALQRTPQIELELSYSDAFKEDIKTFLDEKLRDLSIPGSDEMFHQELMHTLSSRAGETFFWVGYIAKELCRSISRPHAEEILRVLPQDLYGIYGHMLSKGLRNHTAKLGRVSFILHTVTLASRPLTINELGTVYSVQFGGQGNSNKAVRGLISLCGDFLRIHPRSGERTPSSISGKHAARPFAEHDHVTLFHESAKRYLLRPDVDNDSLLEDLRIQDKKKVHFRLARICLFVVAHSHLRDDTSSLGSFQVQRQSTAAAASSTAKAPFRANEPRDLGEASLLDSADHQNTSPLERLESMSGGPLFQYAAHHWAAHARKAQEEGRSLIYGTGAMSIFTGFSSMLMNWMAWYKSCSSGQDRPTCAAGDVHLYIIPKPTRVDPLPLACSLGIGTWVQALFDRPRSFAARIEWNQLLYMAIINSQRAVVTILHGKGVNINNDTMPVPDHQQHQLVAGTPLFVACSLKDTRMVDHLISLGADVNLITKCGLSALDLVRQRKRLRRSLLPILLRACSINQDTEIDKLVSFATSPFSLSAAVSGLTVTATTVHQALYHMASGVSNAPKSICEALEIVQETSEAIFDVRNLMTRVPNLEDEEERLIRLDQLTTVIQDLIMTLSELEFLTVKDTTDSLTEGPNWNKEEAKILELLATLKVSNSCLSMMFAIAIGDPHGATQDELEFKIDQTLQKSYDVDSRSEFHPTSTFSRVSGHSTAMRISKALSTTTVNQLPRGLQPPQADMWSEHRMSAPRYSTTHFTGLVRQFSGDFETALENSHVYSRFKANCELDVSAAGSTFNGSAWSSFSRFSFNDISVMSVYRLPVILSEVDAISSHLTFGHFMRNYQTRASSTRFSKVGDLSAHFTLAATADRLKQMRREMALKPQFSVNVLGDLTITTVPPITLVVVGPPGDIKSRLLSTLMSQECLSNRSVFGPIDQTAVSITESTWEKSHCIVLRDTTGVEEWDSLRRIISEDADALLVAFSAVSSNLSLDQLFGIAEEYWLEERMLHHPDAYLVFVAVHTTLPNPGQRMDGELTSRVVYKHARPVTRVLGLQCSLDHVESVTRVFAKAADVVSGDSIPYVGGL